MVSFNSYQNSCKVKMSSCSVALLKLVKSLVKNQVTFMLAKQDKVFTIDSIL